MSGFHALFQAQHKLAKQRLQEKASTFKCPKCSQRFGNKGALASHLRFLHPSKPYQKNKLAFPDPPLEPPRPKRKNPPCPPQDEDKSDCDDAPPAKVAKTRARFRNSKKLDLARGFKSLKQNEPLTYQERWLELHPSVFIRTVERWVSEKHFCQIEADGLHENPRVRNAFVSSKRLDYLNQGLFPVHEERLFDMFVQRRERMLVVPRIWFRTRMKKLLKERPPAGTAWKAFVASPGWAHNFFGRFDVSRRARSNMKAKSPQQRLPEVQKFHRTAKRFRQPPPLRDEKYGRFPPINTLHVDQVPYEPARKIFETTYEMRGARRVQIKSPKVDLSKRQSTLQLTFAAGGPQPVRPGICFRAKPKTTKLPDGSVRVDPSKAHSKALNKERSKMPKDIDVFYQKKAWFDTETCMAYAKGFRKQTGASEKLLGLDNLTSHCTPRFKAYMKQHANTLLLFSPDGCTDLCAVVDAGKLYVFFIALAFRLFSAISLLAQAVLPTDCLRLQK